MKKIVIMKSVITFSFSRKIEAYFLILFLSLFTTNCVSQSRHQLIVVTFGNSTTASRKGIRKVYAVRLGEILTKAGVNNKVINSGVPGSHTGSVKDNNRFKIAHGLDRFDTAVLRYHPDWVTINFGINDSWQDAGRKGTSRIPVKKYQYNLSFFIDRILAQKGKVILLTPNPIGEKYKGFHRRRLKKYMKVTRKLARAKNLPLIDTWKIFPEFVRKMHAGIDTLLLDGMHPNDTGHKIIANALAKIIISYSK